MSVKRSDGTTNRQTQRPVVPKNQLPVAPGRVHQRAGQGDAVETAKKTNQRYTPGGSSARGGRASFGEGSVHGTQFGQSTSGDPTVNLNDPALRAKHQTNGYRAERFYSPTFVDGIDGGDVIQGSIADCYFVAVLSSIAETDPEQIRKMIRDHDDGTCSVRFYTGYRLNPKHIRVDRDLYVRSPDSPLYSTSKDRDADGKLELWPALVEKAYAVLHGSYEAMGNGGNKSKVLEEVYGKRAGFQSLASVGDAQLKSLLKRVQAKGLPMVAATFGKDTPQASRYNGQRLSPWHAYALYGVSEKGGEFKVKLRNPWGHTEPGNDGKNDGVFELSLADFRHFFRDISWAGGRSTPLRNASAIA